MNSRFVNIVEGGMGVVEKSGQFDGLYTVGFSTCLVHCIVYADSVALIHDNGFSSVAKIQKAVSDVGHIVKVYVVQFDDSLNESIQYAGLSQEHSRNEFRVQKIYSGIDVEYVYTGRMFTAISRSGELLLENDYGLCDDPEAWSDDDQKRYAVNKINAKLGDDSIDVQFVMGKVLSHTGFILPKDVILTKLPLGTYEGEFFRFALENWGEQLPFRD